jgi:hypothetical protein
MLVIRLCLGAAATLLLAAALATCKGRAVTGAEKVHGTGIQATASKTLETEDYSGAVFERDEEGLPVYRSFSELVARGDIKPHDAPGNPYAGQYDEVDQWITENCQLLSDRYTAALWYDKRVEGRTNFVLIDSNGYVLPASSSKVLDEARKKQSRDVSEYRYLHAKGEMTPMMADAISRLRMKAMAQFLPPVPDWLAANPPEQGAVLLPDGNVLTIGPRPGQPWEHWDREAGHVSHSHNTDWHLYSNDGELLYDKNIYHLYYRPDALDIMKEREIDFEMHPGYLLLFDRKTREFVKGYDYDGTELSRMPTDLKRLSMPLLRPDLIVGIRLAQSH